MGLAALAAPRRCRRRPSRPGRHRADVGRAPAGRADPADGRAARGRPAARGDPAGLPPGPDVLVVLDGARRLRTLPGVVQLLREGPGGRGTPALPRRRRRQLPEECRGVVDCPEHGRVSLHRTGPADVARILPDLVEVAWADRVARALAPLRDTTPTSRTRASRPRPGCSSAATSSPPRPRGSWRRWGPEPSTDVVLGAGYDGAVPPRPARRRAARADRRHDRLRQVRAAADAGGGAGHRQPAGPADLRAGRLQGRLGVQGLRPPAAHRRHGHRPRQPPGLAGPDLTRRRAEAPRAPARRAGGQGPRGLLGAAGRDPRCRRCRGWCW